MASVYSSLLTVHTFSNMYVFHLVLWLCFIRRIHFLPDSHSELSLGRRVSLFGCSAWLSSYCFVSFYFSIQREWDRFCCVTSACYVSAASSCVMFTYFFVWHARLDSIAFQEILAEVILKKPLSTFYACKNCQNKHNILGEHGGKK